MRTGARTSVEGWDDARADDEETPVLASGRKRASVDSWRRCAWVIVASACIAALGLIFEVDGAVSVKTGRDGLVVANTVAGTTKRGRRAPGTFHTWLYSSLVLRDPLFCRVVMEE